MPVSLMTLKILLPFRVFVEKTDVSRIVVETQNGSLGLLPHRLDCVAALMPGILTYETDHDGEIFVAVDEGVMIKAGSDVVISVRRALGGNDLGRLRSDVESEFLNLGEAEKSARLITAKLESDFLRRFVGLRHD
jgi:F-type H+-transporting ATPase subunit epsilon